MPDPNRTYALECIFCDKILTSGVTRVKYHLAGIKKCNATPCQKVPQVVKEEMKVLLLKSNDAKDKKITELEKIRSSVNLDHSEGEEESDDDSDNDIVLSTQSRSRSQGGPMDKFCMSSVEECVKRNQGKLSAKRFNQSCHLRRQKRGGIELVGTYVSFSMKLAIHTTR